MNGKYYAFTLAEVLITLVIIGVIAAMTIPTLINKTNNQEYVSRLKKAYSTLSQVTNRLIAEEGSPKNGWLQTGDIDSVYNKYKKYLSIAKDCGEASGCLGNSSYKSFLNNDGYNFEKATHRKLILADGTLVIFNPDMLDNSCSGNAWGSIGVCASILVDVNGDKKPNRYGRDFFAFALKENGLYPMGCESNHCEGTEGDGCTCKVIREGAINY